MSEMRRPWELASPPWAPPPRRPVSETEPLAWVALALAISSFLVVPLVLAVVALVVAHMAERRMADSHAAGEGLARAAKVVAWANIAMVVLAVVVVVALISAH